MALHFPSRTGRLIVRTLLGLLLVCAILAVADYLSRKAEREGGKQVLVRDVLAASIKAHEIEAAAGDAEGAAPARPDGAAARVRGPGGLTQR